MSQNRSNPKHTAAADPTPSSKLIQLRFKQFWDCPIHLSPDFGYLLPCYPQPFYADTLELVPQSLFSDNGFDGHSILLTSGYIELFEDTEDHRITAAYRDVYMGEHYWLFHCFEYSRLISKAPAYFTVLTGLVNELNNTIRVSTLSDFKSDQSEPPSPYSTDA